MKDISRCLELEALVGQDHKLQTLS